jgi:hypothetical protein
MKYLSISILVSFLYLQVQGQAELSYYLPQDVTYNKNIPTPKEVLGYEVGEWHVGHDQLVYYMQAIAKASDRVTIETFARTYENRPLVLLTITSPDNHKNIETIRAKHVELSDAKKSKKLNTSKMPVVVYQGYSIHGNEASGSNAALLYAYYLAAAEGKAIEKKLDNTIVLLDPSFNPDGMNRFASWVNTHKSDTPVPDPNDREYNEAWPRGRTNHYWFDLNRDWLLTQHPESQGRIRNFHNWKPNILTDHHEMGTNSTFFFQPGVPSRTHPITPKKNQELTGQIGEYHAKFLDEIGSLYYTKESFDDFYYGKGSTYPDVNGSIGILFEQASSRGHIQESVHGLLTFPFTIRNQFTTSLSTLEAANGLRTDLLDWQRTFYTTASDEAKADEVKAYVFGDVYDKARTAHFIELLQRHEVRIYKNKASITKDGQDFAEENTYIIPTNQPQYRLIKAVFEMRTTFTDSLFYDVSGFNLALAFNMPFAEMKGVTPSLGDLVGTPKGVEGTVKGGQSNYAYLFRWDEYYTPKAMYEILNKGLVAKVLNAEMTIPTGKRNEAFGAGTIMIPVARQSINSADLHEFLKGVATRSGIEMVAVNTGLSTKGVTIGSPSWSTLRLPKTLVAVDDGVSSYDAGEVWHLFDQRFKMPITKMPSSRLNSTNLDKYNTIILVNGSYDKAAADNIREWLRQGNTLIVYRGAIGWANRNKLANVKFVSSKSNNKTRRPYNKLSPDRGAMVIGGAIFETEADLTNPLLYGYHRENIPVFHRGTSFLEPTKNSYATPLLYTNKAILNGYISDDNLKKVKNSAAIIVNQVGRGRTICLSDNTNFRAFWYGTNKILMNAVFFGHTISSGAAE